MTFRNVYSRGHRANFRSMNSLIFQVHYSGQSLPDSRILDLTALRICLRPGVTRTLVKVKLQLAAAAPKSQQ